MVLGNGGEARVGGICRGGGGEVEEIAGGGGGGRAWARGTGR